MTTGPEPTQPDDAYPAHWRTARPRTTEQTERDDTDAYPAHWATARNQQEN